MDKSFRKGLQLLETLARSDAARGVTELATGLGLNKSNVFRLLRTLLAEGYVRQDPATEKYGCTLKLWELGAAVAEHLDLKRVARPFLEQLARQTAETVNFSILDGREVLYLDKIDSPQPIRTQSKLGGRAPAYCVATGKALIAHLDEAELRSRFSKLKRYTDDTIVEPAALQAELAGVRKKGYAVNRGEWREGISGLAAPVFDAGRRAQAALGLSGPMERFSAIALKRLAPLVVSAAERMSKALAGS